MEALVGKSKDKKQDGEFAECKEAQDGELSSSGAWGLEEEL